MATMKAYAINEIQRPIPGAVKEEGKQMPFEIIGATRVFDATEKEMDVFERLGAARPATKAEERAEEDRIETEGAAVSRQTLFRSVGPGSGAPVEETPVVPAKAEKTKPASGSAL